MLTSLVQCATSLFDSFVNTSGATQCNGCQEIESLLAQSRNHEGPEAEYMFEMDGNTHVHATFRELDRCATETQCLSCQLIRRAILLEQGTSQQVEELVRSVEPIRVHLHKSTKELRLEVALDSSRAERPAWIECSDKRSAGQSTSTGISTMASRACAAFQNQVEKCHSGHNHCRRVQPAPARPSWLIQLQGNGKARLFNPSTITRDEGLFPYVAVSYSWALDRNLSAKDMLKERCRAIKTAANLSETSETTFDRSELPQTVQDAMAITESFEIGFIWVDCICVADDGWSLEASRMHEVYGNAHFTLATAGSLNGSDALLIDREAWRFSPESCRLDEYWLSTTDIGIDLMRERSPLSKRGWILQEEWLSPRVLYWCPNRVYWSCMEDPEIIEGAQGLKRKSNDMASSTQRFLEVCRLGGSKSEIHDTWLEIVRSYLLRDFSTITDRFPAISSLAAVYLESTEGNDEYLMGLWRDTLAHDLTWSVTRACPGHLPECLAPTWSWASLPANTQLSPSQQAFQQSPYFRLMAPERPVASGSFVESIQRGVCAQGSGKLVVKGRCRRFIDHKSLKRSWPEGNPDAAFSNEGYRAVHARDLSTGRILVKAANKPPILGQLDYAVPYEGCIADGDEREIFCMEIGMRSMLMLRGHHQDSGSGICYARVGVSNDFREGFFHNAKVETVWLI